MHMMESSLGTMRWDMVKDNIADTKLESAMEARNKIKADRKKEVIYNKLRVRVLGRMFRTISTTVDCHCLCIV